MIEQQAVAIKKESFQEPSEKALPELFEEISRDSEYTDEDKALLKKAFLFAGEHYETKEHKSSISLMQHCTGLARKLWTIKADARIIAAGLLHDILKNTPVQMEDLSREFGDEIAQLVSGIQKFHVPESQKKRYLENLETLFLEMARDARIIIIRLVHRLDDLDNLEWRKPSDRKKILKETRELFIPLADKIGMRSIRSRLEDQSFRHTSPQIYNLLIKKLEQTKKEDESYLEQVEHQVRNLLQENTIQATVTGRIKNTYSLYRKMLLQKKPLDKLLDRLAIRIIVNDIPACYTVLGILHTNFTHVPNTFDDYISLPKANNYQSLHTCIYAVGNASEKPIEIQIRTTQMNQVAEYGIAAHWKYKEDSDTPSDPGEHFSWIKNLIELKKTHKSTSSFYSALKKNITLKYIIVFDEKGNVIYIPKDSTPMEYANHRGISLDPQKDRIRINGKFAKINAKIQDGDTIEIMREDTGDLQPRQTRRL